MSTSTTTFLGAGRISTYTVSPNVRTLTVIAVGGGGGGAAPINAGNLSDNARDGETSWYNNQVYGYGGGGGRKYSGGAGGGGFPAWRNGSTGRQATSDFNPKASPGYAPPFPQSGYNNGFGGPGATLGTSNSSPHTYGGGGGGAGRKVYNRGDEGAVPGQTYNLYVGNLGRQAGRGNQRPGTNGAVYIITRNWDKPDFTFTSDVTEFVNDGTQGVTFTWEVTTEGDAAATNVALKKADGTVVEDDLENSGELFVQPTESTTYVLEASNPGLSRTRSISIEVYQPVVNIFTASINPLIAGQSTILSWEVQGSADTASIDQSIGNVSFVGSTAVSPSTSTSYTLSSSGPGGTDVDTLNIVVNQVPQISANFPIEIDYDDALNVNVTYRYATSGVSIVGDYSYFGGTNSTKNYTLPGTASDESGEAVVETFSPSIPWNNFGPTLINFTLTANGGGGSTSIGPFNIDVNIDRLPDSVNIPDRLEQPISQDPVVSPDEETVLTDPITINGIDIPVEITASKPIQVRFDNDDPTIEANWKSLRSI
jgi:hypothetical protein